MTLNKAQKEQILNLLENCKQKEYKTSNAIIENAVNEWKENKKTDKEAYNKIYKKVIKNEHHLVNRYADLNDEKCIRTLAEVFSDDIVNILDFEELDADIRKEVLKITGIKK